MKQQIFLVLSIFAVHTAQAEEMPCVKVEKELLNHMSYLNTRNVKDFSACIRNYRVCLLTFSGQVLKAQTIRNVPRDGVVTFGIVQTPPNEEVTLCLSGVFSGGSAAAWLFDGWQMKNGNPTKLSNMDKAQLNSDAVPPRSLANAIYWAYEQYGQ